MTQELSIIFHGLSLLINVEHFNAAPERGPKGYSLGSPAEPAHVVIQSVKLTGLAADSDELEDFIMENFYNDE